VQTRTFQVIDSADAEWRGRFLERLAQAREEGQDYDALRKMRLETQPLVAQGNIYYRVYKTKDSYLVVGCLSNPLRRKFCAAVDIEDKRLEDPDWDPMQPASREYAKQLVATVEALFRERTTDAWLAIFDDRGVPAGPFRFTEELVDDPQVIANGLQVEVEHSLVGTVRMVGPPLQMSETPLAVQGASPALGEHTDDILSSLGYDRGRIEALRSAGTVR
jgi:formyl-CoA transferase